jgi:cytochrome P450
VQPAFGTTAIRRYLERMVDEANRELDTWRIGAELDAYTALRQAIRRIAVGTLFGDALGVRAEELGQALGAALSFVNRLPAAQIHLEVPGSAWRRAQRARDRADEIITAEIARRRARPATQDLLDCLLTATDDEGSPALDDGEVRDQVVSLIAAGYDTTSAAAGWAVHELLSNPGAWEQAADEVDAVVGSDRLAQDHLSQLTHLDHVVRETLRLWPPAAASARRCTADTDFAGYRIPAGTMILYSAYVTHRMDTIYPEPDRFRPDRWTDANPDPYAFVPFGGGYRRCIGFAFATQELKILLAELLRRTRLEPLRRRTRPTGLAALRPKGGVPVRIIGARPAPRAASKP